MKILVLGHGYSTKFIANELQEHQLIFTSRNPEISDAHTHLFSINSNLSTIIKELEDTSHVIISIPPSGLSNRIHQELLPYMNNIRWLGYLSSTGVYGDHKGAWVNEQSKLLCTEQYNIERIKTENAWMNSALPVHIFRLAGIYGPERNILNHISSGKAKYIYKEGHYFSRIHVEDLAEVVIKSMHKPNSHSIYNVADTLPTEYHKIIEYAYKLLSITPPNPLKPDDSSISPMMKNFLSNNKRISTEKIFKEFHDLTLKYPTYKEGLLSIKHSAF